MRDYVIRKFHKEEIEALLELNIVEQGEWYHGLPNGQLTSNPARWEELSSYERWLHGGWWLDPKTIALYVDMVEETQGIILVAERNGEFIGELDLSIGYDPIFKEIRAHFLWLVVHPQYRRKGIANSLIQTAMSLMRNKNVQALYTEAEDSKSEQLYMKTGFKTVTTITEKIVYSTEINDEEIEGLEYRNERINPRSIPVDTYYRVLGLYYTPQWDTIRASRLGELYDILGVPIPEPSFVKTNLGETTAYIVLDHRPRIFVEKLDSETIKTLTKIAIIESYFEAHGPEQYLQYYDGFEKMLGLENKFQVKQEGIPLLRKEV